MNEQKEKRSRRPLVFFIIIFFFVRIALNKFIYLRKLHTRKNLYVESIFLPFSYFPSMVYCDYEYIYIYFFFILCKNNTTKRNKREGGNFFVSFRNNNFSFFIERFLAMLARTRSPVEG